MNKLLKNWGLTFLYFLAVITKAADLEQTSHPGGHHTHSNQLNEIMQSEAAPDRETGAFLTRTSQIDSAIANGGKLLVVDVLGVVCDFCAIALTKVFNQQKEVAASHIDLNKKTLSLVLFANSDLTDEKIADLAVQAGYRISGVQRGFRAPKPTS